MLTLKVGWYPNNGNGPESVWENIGDDWFPTNAPSSTEEGEQDGAYYFDCGVVALEGGSPDDFTAQLTGLRLPSGYITGNLYDYLQPGDRAYAVFSASEKESGIAVEFVTDVNLYVEALYMTPDGMRYRWGREAVTPPPAVFYLGWDTDPVKVGGLVRDPGSSGGDFGTLGGRPPQLGAVNSDDRWTQGDVDAWTQNYVRRARMPVRWAQKHTLVLNVKFTPMDGSPVIEYNDANPGEHFAWSISPQEPIDRPYNIDVRDGIYEFRLLVDGYPSANRLYAVAYSSLNGGSAYGTVTWYGEGVDAGGGTTFWTGFRGTEEIVSEGGGNA